MSDLIPTPSQSQSPVSNEAFEALIDLLASDGADENPSRLAEDDARARPNVTSLRDTSGKLDFDKIRSMFVAQGKTDHASTTPRPLGDVKDRVRSPTAPHEDSESDDEHRSHRSASTVASRSHSMSPKPVDNGTAGHRRSSTFGNQPWTAIHENPVVAKVEDVAPTPSHQPLSFDELNAALVGAHDEVRTLRRQYEELQALVSKRLGAELRDQARPAPGGVNTKKIVPNKENGHVETHAAGSQASQIAVVPQVSPPSDLPAEIVSLSEDEAKRALSALARSLSLSLNAIGSVANPSPAMPSSPRRGLFAPSATREHDVPSITRALKFLGSVDELVWRRTLAPSGPRTLQPVYSDENIVALLARLELWERAVRRSSRI